MIATPIVVASTPGGAETSGMAAAIGVASARQGSGAALLVELACTPDEPIHRPPTLLASSQAREIERSLRDTGLQAASRGHICTLSLDLVQMEEIGVEALVELAGISRVVFSLGADGIHETIFRIHEAVHPLSGLASLLLLDLPQERSLGALIAAEMLSAGIAIKVTRVRPGLVASRRALAGVTPGGQTERYAERVVDQLSGRRVRQTIGE